MKVIKLLLVTLLSLLSFDMYAPEGAQQEYTPLQKAAANAKGDSDSVQDLIKKGADVNAQTESSGNTAAHYAAMRGDHATLSVLKDSGADLTIKNKNGETANDVINKFNNKGGIAFAPEATEPSVAMPVKVKKSVSFGDNTVNVVDRLPEQFAKPEASTQASRGDNFVISPQEESNQQARLDQAVSNKDLNVKNLKTLNPFKYTDDLIASAKDGSIDVNTKDRLANTALHYTTYDGTLEDTQKLLNLGANPDVQDGKNGNTPLHLAVENGDSAKVAALIKAGANPKIKNNKGETPLFNAAKKGDNNSVTALLQSDKSDVNEDGFNGATALHAASSKGHTDVMQTLIAHNADINAVSLKNSNTPLHVAKNREATQLLLSNRANKDAVNQKTGKTADLHKNIGDRISDLTDWFKSIPKSIADSFNNTVSSIKSFFTSSSKAQQQGVADNLSSVVTAVQVQEKTYENSAPGMKGNLASRQVARKNNDANVSLEKHLTDTLSDYNKLRDFQAKGEDTTELQELFEKDLVDVVVASKNNSEMAVKIKGLLDTMDSTSNLNKSVQLQADQIIADREAQKNNHPLPLSPAPTELPKDLGKPQVEGSNGVHILLREPSAPHQNEGVEYTDQKDEKSAPPVPLKTAALGYNAAPSVLDNAPQGISVLDSTASREPLSDDNNEKDSTVEQEIGQEVQQSILPTPLSVSTAVQSEAPAIKPAPQGDASPQFAQNEITPSLTTSRVPSEDNADAFSDLLKLQPESVQSPTMRDSQGRPLGSDGKLLLPPAPLSSPMLKPAPPVEPSIAPVIKPAPPAPRSALNPDVLKALKRPTDSNQQADTAKPVTPDSIINVPGEDGNQENPINTVKPAPRLFNPTDLQSVKLSKAPELAAKPLPKPNMLDRIKTGVTLKPSSDRVVASGSQVAQPATGLRSSLQDGLKRKNLSAGLKNHGEDDDDGSEIEGFESTSEVSKQEQPVPAPSSPSTFPTRPSIDQSKALRAQDALAKKAANAGTTGGSLFDQINKKAFLTKATAEEVKTSTNAPKPTSQLATGGLRDSKEVNSMLQKAEEAQAKSVGNKDNEGSDDNDWNS